MSPVENKKVSEETLREAVNGIVAWSTLEGSADKLGFAARIPTAHSRIDFDQYKYG